MRLCIGRYHYHRVSLHRQINLSNSVRIKTFFVKLWNLYSRINLVANEITRKLGKYKNKSKQIIKFNKTPHIYPHKMDENYSPPDHKQNGECYNEEDEDN